jgi:peptide/bleomycin uptake transporter
MQYLLKSWPTIIELASVYKRLREFERELKAKTDTATDSE